MNAENDFFFLFIFTPLPPLPESTGTTPLKQPPRGEIAIWCAGGGGADGSIKTLQPVSAAVYYIHTRGGITTRIILYATRVTHDTESRRRPTDRRTRARAHQNNNNNTYINIIKHLTREHCTSTSLPPPCLHPLPSSLIITACVLAYTIYIYIITEARCHARKGSAKYTLLRLFLRCRTSPKT